MDMFAQIASLLQNRTQAEATLKNIDDQIKTWLKDNPHVLAVAKSLIEKQKAEAEAEAKAKAEAEAEAEAKAKAKAKAKVVRSASFTRQTKPPPCNAGDNCTWGSKCRYYHPPKVATLCEPADDTK